MIAVVMRSFLVVKFVVLLLVVVPPRVVHSLPPFLQSEQQRAFTAYGPGLAVFAPFSYVDAFYDNLPFIGKIPVLGKDGTSSRTGISPFYPPNGNPSNPLPPLYKARPLPIHAPDPVEVVAVPLDEEALHGEPLFPKELTLPWLMEKAVPKEKSGEKSIDEPEGPSKNPFGEEGGESFSEVLDEFGAEEKGKTNAKAKTKVEKEEELRDSAEFESAEAVAWPNLGDRVELKVNGTDPGSSEYEDEQRKRYRHRQRNLAVLRRNLIVRSQ